MVFLNDSIQIFSSSEEKLRCASAYKFVLIAACSGETQPNKPKIGLIFIVVLIPFDMHEFNIMLPFKLGQHKCGEFVVKAFHHPEPINMFGGVRGGRAAPSFLVTIYRHP